jgi:hypothetical protein
MPFLAALTRACSRLSSCRSPVEAARSSSEIACSAASPRKTRGSRGSTLTAAVAAAAAAEPCAVALAIVVVLLVPMALGCAGSQSSVSVRALVTISKLWNRKRCVDDAARHQTPPTRILA